MCWTWGLPLSVVFIPNEIPLKNTIFLLVSSQQLKQSLDQGLGIVFITPLSPETPSCLGLCIPCACCQVSVSSYVHWSCCVQQHGDMKENLVKMLTVKNHEIDTFFLPAASSFSIYLPYKYLDNTAYPLKGTVNIIILKFSA